MLHSKNQPTHDHESQLHHSADADINKGHMRIHRNSYDYFHTSDSPHNQVILYLCGDHEITDCPQEQQLAFAAHLSHLTKKRVLPYNPFLNSNHPFPDVLMNIQTIYTGLFTEGFPANNIIIGADSIAGGLTMALMLILKDKDIRLPKAVFLFSPWLDLTISGESFDSKVKTDAVLTKDRLLQWAMQYYSSNDPRNPYISPITSPSRFFPPLLIQVGGQEILLSDSIDFSSKLRAAGCPIELKVWEEMGHGWHRRFEEISQADQALQMVRRFVSENLPDKPRKL